MVNKIYKYGLRGLAVGVVVACSSIDTQNAATPDQKSPKKALGIKINIPYAQIPKGGTNNHPPVKTPPSPPLPPARQLNWGRDEMADQGKTQQQGPSIVLAPHVMSW